MDVLLFSIRAPADEPFDITFVHTHTDTNAHALTYARFQAKSVAFDFLGTPAQSHRTSGKITVFLSYGDP